MRIWEINHGIKCILNLTLPVSGIACEAQIKLLIIMVSKLL